MMTTVPERIQDIATCYFWYRGSEPDEDLWPFFRPDQLLVITCPESCPRLIKHFRAGGGIVLLYVSIYKAPLITEVPDDLKAWEGGSPFRSSVEQSPFWREVDLAGHADWVLHTPEGNWRRPFDLAQYMPGWYQTTALSTEYAQAVCDGIANTCGDGCFDGVFVDNVHPAEEPSMVQLDGQLAVADMVAHADAFYELVRRLRRIGDRSSNGHFWMMSNGARNVAMQEIADIMCFESFPFSWAHPGASCDEATAVKHLLGPGRLLDCGGRVVVLSYLGFSGNPIGEDARLVRRVADRAGAIYADFLTLVRPEIMGAAGRAAVAAWPEDFPSYDSAKAALALQCEGAPKAAEAVYCLSPS